MRKERNKSITERGTDVQIQMLKCRDKRVKNSIPQALKNQRHEDFFKTQVEMKDIPDAINGIRLINLKTQQQKLSKMKTQKN